MLTPQEITEKVFVKAVFGGYDMTGVDDFLEVLTADYTALYKENAILKSKLKVLVEKVEEYRSTEDAMRMALLTAQRMGEEMTIEASKKKEELLQNAETEAKEKLAETAQRINDEEMRLGVAAKETSRFIELSKALMRKHTEFLSKLETAVRTVHPEPEPPPPTYKEQVADAAQQIGDAVERITNLGMDFPPNEYIPDYDDEENAPPDAAENNPAPPDAAPPAAPQPGPEYEDENEPTKPYIPKEDEDAVSPRPKFDFDDLKFGSNFKKK